MGWLNFAAPFTTHQPSQGSLTGKTHWFDWKLLNKTKYQQNFTKQGLKLKICLDVFRGYLYIGSIEANFGKLSLFLDLRVVIREDQDLSLKILFSNLSMIKVSWYVQYAVQNRYQLLSILLSVTNFEN